MDTPAIICCALPKTSDMRPIILFLFTLLASGCIYSQSLNVTGTIANGNSNALANDFLVPNPGGALIWDAENGALGPFIAGLWGNDFATTVFLHAKEDGQLPKPHEVSSYVGNRAFINGDNTNTVHIKWKNTGANYSRTDGHNAEISTNLNITVTMEVSGLPPGNDAIVYWWYNIFGAGSTSHEDPVELEDSIMVVNSMSLNGNQLFGGEFNFASPNGLPGWNEWNNVTGSFKVEEGDVFNFTVTSDINLYLNDPAEPGNFGPDQNDGIFKGEIYFTIITQYPVPVDNLEDMQPLFSLDIGSDTEISDPKGDGNEYFDPGDMYPKYQGSPLPSVSPWSNDSSIFAHDPDPKPFPPFNPAPVSSGQPPTPIQPIFFDLDGSDLVEFSLQNMTYGPGNPSIAWFSDSCVFEAEYYFLSYDDDGAGHYASSVPSAPVNSASPVTGTIFSESGSRDEVKEYGYDPYPIAGPYFEDTLFSEGLLHTNMLPDPVGIEDQDDDVDALDMIPASGSYTPCTEWYFSADHEAAYNHPSIPSPYLNPATIYQVTASGPVDVVNSAHHGLLDGTDIDAFEFGWLWDFDELRLGLALLFSVDDDDPLTVDDESGGLDPGRIYYSFLNGNYDTLSSNILTDDIDGITLWGHSLNGIMANPNPVWGTKTWEGDQDSVWNNILNWFPVGVPFHPEIVTVPLVSTMPVISTNGLDCKELNVSPGASVIITGGNTFTVEGP